jgi:hypothetical protein
MLPQTLNHNIYVQGDPLKAISIVLFQLTVFNKDRHMTFMKKARLGV